MKSIVIILISVFCLHSVAYGQKNLQAYTPSILFDKGEWEVKSFQNLYTQKHGFTDRKKARTGRGRENYFTSSTQALFGINGQLNVGFDVWVRNVTNENSNGGDYKSRTAVSGIGPKIKVAPFKHIERLSIQSTLLLPVVKNQEGIASRKPYLSDDATLWLTQFYYDMQISSQFQLFFQQAFWFYKVRDSFRANNYLKTQSSVFASYFPTTKWTIYAMTEVFPTHYNHVDQTSEAFFAYFVQSGIGAKFQVIPNVLELETLYSNFWLGNGDGAGQTFNLGIRIIHQ